MLSETYLTDGPNRTRYSETLVGRVHVTEAFTRRLTGQTACNYTDVRVEPGAYDVVLSSFSCGHNYWALVRYHGEIVDEHYVNRLFTATSIAPKRNLGQESGATSQGYAYEAAKSFATDPAWELAEDWHVECTQRKYEDGRRYTSFKLVQNDA